MLRYRYRPRHRRLSSALGPCSGPQGRIKSLQKTVTEVFRKERIETNYGRCDEARGYVERLIQEAIKHGDKHRATMEMADFWLLEKDLIHKLFKVFVPRYQKYSTSFTRVWNLPIVYPGKGYEQAVLELKGNPWPPVVPVQREKSNYLSNVLLTAARTDHRMQEYARQSANMTHTAKGDNSLAGVDNSSPSSESDTAETLITETENLKLEKNTTEEGVK